MLRKILLRKRGQTGEGFVCHVRDGLEESTLDLYRGACEKLDFYAEHEAKRYCVLHFPAQNKAGDFRQAVESKLMRKDFNFRGAYFPQSPWLFKGYEFGADVTFDGAIFSGNVNFRKAIFKQEADFSKSIFEGKADFSEAIFEETKMENAKQEGSRERPKELKDADFADASFRRKADFKKVRFKGEANFYKATFEEEADFSETIFKGEARFRRVTFKDLVEFKEPDNSIKAGSGKHCKQYCFNARANFSLATFLERATFVGRCMFKTKHEDSTFRNALIEKPGNFLLDRVQLRPSWFIDMNVQGLRFTDVVWRGLPGVEGSIEQEIDAIKRRRQEKKGQEQEPGYPFKVLAQTCRELAANAEENRDYPRANEFHYRSMEAQRKAIPGSAFAFWKLIWWYWLLSGYNERPVRAALWLMAILLGFGIFYMWQGPAGAGLESIVYSLGVMTRLANDIPDSESVLVRSFVILEGVLGPFQIALFALALRRRFMR